MENFKSLGELLKEIARKAEEKHNEKQTSKDV